MALPLTEDATPSPKFLVEKAVSPSGIIQRTFNIELQSQVLV